MSCNHYWKIIGGGKRRWWGSKDGTSHALIRCVHCSAWSVTEYGKGIGPCSHVVEKADAQKA